MDALNKPWVIAIVILGLVGYSIVRRLAGQPLNARELFSTPLILTAVGGYQLIQANGLAPVDYIWAAAGILVGVACGAWRGSTIQVFLKDGVLWQRYNGRTFLVWVLSLLGSGGFVLLAMVLGMNPEARPTTLSIGIGMLGEVAIVGLRALATGERFSPDYANADERKAVVNQHMKDTFRGEARGEDLNVGVRDGIERVTAQARATQRH